MKRDDVKMALRKAKFQHLTEDELDSYQEQTLDEIGRARAEAHLNLCLVCEKRLALLKEERAVLGDREVTTEDIALVRRVMKQMELERQPSGSKPVKADKASSLSARLAEYLQQAAASWKAHFRQLKVVRGSVDTGHEVWRWESGDGVLKARAHMEKNADLTIHFSSNEPDLEGERFIIRLGVLSQEAAWERISDSEVYARVQIPQKQYRREDWADISMERTA